MAGSKAVDEIGAMGSACELECELIIACDPAFIAESVQEQALTVLIEITRMLTGSMNRLIAARTPNAAS